MVINEQRPADEEQTAEVAPRVVTSEHIMRSQDLLDAYDALRACFPDVEFHEAWEPNIEPLLWARPEERDPTWLEHVDTRSQSSPLWAMVRRFLDHQNAI